jgi:hypothetical protein
MLAGQVVGMLFALILMLVTLGKEYARNADRKPMARKAKPEPIWLQGQAEPILDGDMRPQEVEETVT